MPLSSIIPDRSPARALRLHRPTALVEGGSGAEDASARPRTIEEVAR